MNKESLEFKVDGIVFKKEGDNLLMVFFANGLEHKFFVKYENAILMAEGLPKLFSRKN